MKETIFSPASFFLYESQYVLVWPHVTGIPLAGSGGYYVSVHVALMMLDL